jgi:hypothetical protein
VDVDLDTISCVQLRVGFVGRELHGMEVARRNRDIRSKDHDSIPNRLFVIIE